MLYTPLTVQNHFSADVRIELRAEGQIVDVASIGPNEIILRDFQDIGICDAEIAMFIDGIEFLWPVRLPEGAVPFASDVYMVPRGPMVSVMSS